MLLAPYLAELLAARMATGTTPDRLEMFDPDRFDPAATTAGAEQDYYARYATLLPRERSFTARPPCPEPIWGILRRAGQPSGAVRAATRGRPSRTARARCHPWTPTGSRPNRPPTTSRRA